MAIDQRKLSQWETNFQKSRQTLASTAKVSSLADQRAAQARVEADRSARIAAGKAAMASRADEALQKKSAAAAKVKIREALANLGEGEFKNRALFAEEDLKGKLVDRRSGRQAGSTSGQVVTEEHLRLNTMVTATDAPSNLFEVQMRAEGMAPTTEYALLFRTGEFTPPAPALKMLDIPYKGYQVRIPTTAINHTKTLQFKIRVDNQYDVYQELIRLRNTGFDPSDGVKETPPAPWSIRVLALADKSSTAAEQLGTYYQEAASRLVGWEFSGVIVEAVELSAFSHESSNPVFATLKVSYSSYKDILPDSGLPAGARLPIL